MANKDRESLFTQDSYEMLINTANEIKNETKLGKKSFDDKKALINRSLQKIEKQEGFKPSFKHFINQLINEKNLAQAKENIKKQIQDNHLQGFSPDIKIIIENIINDETVNEVEKHFIEMIRTMNEKSASA